VHRAQLVILDWHGSIEENHQAIAGKVLDLAVMLGDDATQLGVVPA
jgi:hypothetical protein